MCDGSVDKYPNEVTFNDLNRPRSVWTVSTVGTWVYYVPNHRNVSLIYFGLKQFKLSDLLLKKPVNTL